MLVFHHILTIFITIWLLLCIIKTANFGFWRLGYYWLLHAVTEQATFVGLFFHKLAIKRAAMYFLYFAALQVLITKMVVNVFLLLVWYREVLPFTGTSTLYTMNTVVFPIVIVLLGWVQVYDCQVTYQIAEKDRRELKKSDFETLSTEIMN
jgi:hypothetical protein